MSERAHNTGQAGCQRQELVELRRCGGKGVRRADFAATRKRDRKRSCLMQDDFDDMYGSKYMAATDLKKPVIATIEQIDRDSFIKPGEKPKTKLVISVKGGKKGIVVNKTNALTLATAFGKDPDEWVGQRIVNKAERTTFGGKPVMGLRLYPAEEDIPKLPKKGRPSSDFNDEIPDELSDV
jgi:hypothetical protein